MGIGQVNLEVRGSNLLAIYGQTLGKFLPNVWSTPLYCRLIAVQITPTVVLMVMPVILCMENVLG